MWFNVLSTAMALLAASTLLVIFRSKKRFPPGPPALPLLGNILDLPKRESWKVYLDWGRAYSALVFTAGRIYLHSVL